MEKKKEKKWWATFVFCLSSGRFCTGRGPTLDCSKWIFLFPHLSLSHNPLPPHTFREQSAPHSHWGYARMAEVGKDVSNYTVKCWVCKEWNEKQGAGMCAFENDQLRPMNTCYLSQASAAALQQRWLLLLVSHTCEHIHSRRRNLFHVWRMRPHQGRVSVTMRSCDRKQTDVNTSCCCFTELIKHFTKRDHQTTSQWQSEFRRHHFQI